MNTTNTVKKINEYQVTKIQKYAGFLLKSNIGDFWAKNTAACYCYSKQRHAYIIFRRREAQFDTYHPERGLL